VDSGGDADGTCTGVRPEDRPFVTADTIPAFTVTATAAAIHQRMHALSDAGYRQLAIQLVRGHDQALEDWARVADGDI
jgi:hypothetical protein